MDLKELSLKSRELRLKYAEFNKKRGEKEWGYVQHAQGFVGDVGELLSLIMAKQGYRACDDLDNKISRELTDCLWSIITIADELNVDLEKGFTGLTEELEERFKNLNYRF
jgi:NTP pyrophosphatase (non-canonical NTP hydrolase)